MKDREKTDEIERLKPDKFAMGKDAVKRWALRHSPSRSKEMRIEMGRRLSADFARRMRRAISIQIAAKNDERRGKY